MSGNTGGGSGGAKETFGAAKKAFNDSKSNGQQGNPNGGQVDDNQEEAGSVQDTAKSSGKGKDGAKKTKDAAKRGKKFFDGLKGIQSLAPLVSALSTIGIALLIIFLIIGFIGFFTTLPGLAMEKFTEACKNFWDWVVGKEKIEISEYDLVDLANYIQDLGYELVGTGFATEKQIERNPDTGKVEKVWVKYDGNPGETPNYLYAYVLQNERTYTLRGVEKTGFNEILSCVPGVGPTLLAKVTNAIEDSIRESNYLKNKPNYGMLHFDKMNKDWWNNLDDFEVEIDRDDMKLKIKTHSGFLGWRTDQVNWDLDGWTGRYGKSIELSLALHLSTMAPDLVYDFCMDDDLQTDIELGSQEVEYTADYTYYPNDDPNNPITKDVINKEMDKHKIDMEISKMYNAMFFSDDRIEPIKLDDNSDMHVPPIEMMEETSIIKVYNYNTSETLYYKAVNKDGEAIRFFNGTKNNPTLMSYYVKVDSNGKPTFQNSKDTEDLTGYSVDPIGIENRSTEIGDYDIEIYWVGMQDMISILNCDGYNDEKYSVIKDLFNEVTDNRKDYGMMQFLYVYDSCINYIQQEEENINWNKPDKGYEIYYGYYDHGKLRKLYDKYSDGYFQSKEKFFEKNNTNELWKEARELLVEMTDKMQKDRNIINAQMEQVIAKRVAEVNELGLDEDTFFLLYKIMNSQSSNVHTFKPYINKVTHHWYKDIYFMPEEKKTPTNWEKAYDFTKEIEDDTGEYNPEGLADTEDIQKLKENGKIMYTLNGTGDNNKDVIQIKQPYIIRTEPWHNKVKNWLTSGYFFIYDGTKETAEEIEAARKVLKNEYDPTDPLLIEYDVVSGVKLNDELNDELLIDSENNEKPEVADIDARAKELNDILASTEYKDGKKYKVRLQKINFAKKSSLAAFSILESVHTKDGEYVYRDLKEFMIELGYFTEADFKLIESGVLDWIIPEYQPDEWPNKKYEKKNDEYGAYIRSKASLDVEKASNVEGVDDSTKDEAPDGTGVVSVNDYLFIGDSITVGYSGVESTTPGRFNSGMSYISKKYNNSALGSCYFEAEISATISNWNDNYDKLIKNAYTNESVKGVVVMLGANGLDVEGMKTLLGNLKSDFSGTPIYVQQTLHFGTDWNKWATGNDVVSHNKEIDQFNEIIKQYCSANGIKFVNTSSGLYAADGQLSYTDDGVHLNKKGCEIIVQNIKSAIGGNVSTSKNKKTIGFEKGLKVITPGKGTVKNVTEDSIVIEFTEENKVKGMTMKIEGIDVDDDLQDGTRETLEKGEQIGETTDKDIKLLMRDSKKAIINNIEDYMQPDKKSGSDIEFSGEVSEEFLYYLGVNMEGMPIDTLDYFVGMDIRDRTITAGPGVTNSCESLFKELGYEEYYPMVEGGHYPKQVIIDVKIAYITERIEEIKQKVNKELTQKQMEALIITSFQRGLGGTQKIFDAINSNDPNLQSIWEYAEPGQFYDGWSKRRKKEYQLYCGGDYIDCYSGRGKLIFATSTPFSDALAGNDTVTFGGE